MPEAKDEKVTMTKAELEQMLADRDAKAKRTPEEKMLRSAIREEIDDALTEKLTSFFDLGENGGAGENDGGGADGGFWGKLAKVFEVTP